MRSGSQMSLLPLRGQAWREWPTLSKFGSAVVVAIAVIVAFSIFAPLYWTNLGTTAASTALLTASVGVLFTRARMLMLCPLSFAAIACWFAGWCTTNGYDNFLVIMVGAIVIVGIFGLIVGLLAIRLRGMYLAVATIAVAAAVTIFMSGFPIPGLIEGIPVTRPVLFTDDRAYFAMSGVVLVIALLVISLILNSRLGTAWAMLSSERAAAAAGSNVLLSKLSAFSIAAMLSAVAGVLLSGQQGFVDVSVFSVGANFLIVVVAIFVGAGYVEGAVLSGIVPVLLGEIFIQIGIPTDIPTIFFGVGAIQALAENPGGISASMRVRRRKKRLAKAARGRHVMAGEAELPA